MARKHLRCRLGIHSYGHGPSPDERPHGPNEWICSRCGKHRTDEWGIIRGFSGPA